MTRRSLLQASAAFSAVQAVGAGVDVTQLGAAGDGKAKDTAAIQKAIDQCERAGGGVVYFPPGNFLSGTLILKSHVTLWLSPGATLWGSRDVADYHPRHLIYAKGAENIAIRGEGTINGQGDAYFGPDGQPAKERLGPLVELIGCRDVRIEDVSIRNSPRWTLHPKNCDRVWIRGISIINRFRANTDGIDPDSSRNVHISDCYIETGDDCIVLKSTNVLPWIPEGYGEPVQTCENVVVTNCTLRSSASALKLGTESLADIRHCAFSNCAIRQSGTGIALMAKDGGNYENITFSNITIETQPPAGRKVSWPIAVDIEKRWPDSRTSRIRGVNFSDIQIATHGRVLVNGMEGQAVEDIAFHNIRMRVNGFEEIAGATKPRGGTAQPLDRARDFGSTPAALILAHVRGLDLRDIRVQWSTDDPPDWHAIYCADVENVLIDGFQGRQSAATGKRATMTLRGAKHVFLTGCRADAGAGTFLALEETDRHEIEMAANDLKLARVGIEP